MSPPPLLALTTTADDPTARNPGQLKSASKVGGEKPMIEIGGKEKQTTIVEDEEDEWTGCVSEPMLLGQCYLANFSLGF